MKEKRRKGIEDLFSPFLLHNFFQRIELEALSMNLNQDSSNEC